MNRAASAERALWLAIVLALLGVTVCVARAFGQPEPDAETVLLRAVVAEATWLERDHRAILHVLGRRAARAGVSIDEHALQYVAAFRAKPTPRTRWVLELQTTCEQPAHWPANLDWEAQRVQCELTVERVRAYLAGDSLDPCRGRADHWGAPDGIDHERAVRAGWKRVACGKTANMFWRVPGGRVIDAQEASGR